MKKLFYLALGLSFLLTCAVPLTGLLVHKLASVVFLLLCLGHVVACRRRMTPRRWGLLALTLGAFVSGAPAMMQGGTMTAVHKLLSLALLAFFAIHAFIYWRKVK